MIIGYGPNPMRECLDLAHATVQTARSLGKPRTKARVVPNPERFSTSNGPACDLPGTRDQLDAATEANPKSQRPAGIFLANCPRLISERTLQIRRHA